MSEQLKFVIQELNKAPFNKKFNLISFDALRPDQLLQILSDVFAELDPKMQADVRNEDPEQLAMKTLNFLRILKYKPPENIPLTTFRQGLVSGDKAALHPILEWALGRMPELRKRAYLARFLVRVELHPELEGDADLVALYSQYEALMEQFKEVHKISEALKGSGFNTQEVRKDIGHMEEEKEQLLKKIARLRRRVDVHSNKDAMLELARNLREEQDKADTLSQQRMNQQDALNHCEQKIQRLTQQLRDLRQSGLGATPEVEFLLDKTQPVVSSDDVRDFSGVVEDDKVYQVYWAGDARTKGSFYDAKVLYMAAEASRIKRMVKSSFQSGGIA
ncbi:intraflagellar transport protein 81 homolog isoform X1 [Ixodes scapularis]